MTDTLDFEIHEIKNLSDKDKPTVVTMKIYGEVDGELIDYETTLVTPPEITTYSKLSEHIYNDVLQPKIYDIYESHKPEPTPPGVE